LTQLYNGTSWLTSANLATARGGGSGMGTQTSALMAGGVAAPGKVATTEEFTGETTAARAVKTIDFD